MSGKSAYRITKKEAEEEAKSLKRSFTGEDLDFVKRAQEERIEKELEKIRRQELKTRINENYKKLIKNGIEQCLLPEGSTLSTVENYDLNSKKAHQVLRDYCSTCLKVKNCNGHYSLLKVLDPRSTNVIPYIIPVQYMLNMTVKHENYCSKYRRNKKG